MVADEVARRYGIQRWKKHDGAEQGYDAARRVAVIKPLSFMNLSGAPVRLIASWYRTPSDGILVVADDMDLPYGKLRFRPFGGHGGHNGLRSIIATAGDGFPRLRVGVGRPAYDSMDHVLSPFSQAERERLPAIVTAAAEAVDRWVDDGLDAAMRQANTWQATDS